MQSRTVAYFAARDSGHLEEAYATFSPAQKVMVPFDGWRTTIKGFNERAGAVGNRALQKVTWYKDPPGRTGTFAAVDFSSEFANLALHCGYLVWGEQPDGSLAVVREEENALDKATAVKLNPGDLERVRADFHCP